MSFTTSPASPALSTNRAAVPFVNSSSDRFSISASALKSPFTGAGRTNERLINVPGQFPPSLRLLRVSINRCRSDNLFEPVELGLKIFDPLLDVFEFLSPPVSALDGTHLLDQYLVVFYESIHTAEGGLEGGKPIGGLFRNIEENLDAFRDSLFLC